MVFEPKKLVFPYIVPTPRGTSNNLQMLKLKNLPTLLSNTAFFLSRTIGDEQQLNHILIYASM